MDRKRSTVQRGRRNLGTVFGAPTCGKAGQVVTRQEGMYSPTPNGSVRTEGTENQQVRRKGRTFTLRPFATVPSPTGLSSVRGCMGRACTYTSSYAVGDDIVTMSRQRNLWRSIVTTL